MKYGPPAKKAGRLCKVCPAPMMPSTTSYYTAVIREDGPWWIGWVEEVPGVNAQEASREALLESLKDVLREALIFNRMDALEAAGPGAEELALTL